MTSLPDSARAVLESPALAHLVTLNPDGSPQVSVVWVGLDGDEVVAGHLPEHRKVQPAARLYHSRQGGSGLGCGSLGRAALTASCTGLQLLR
jgi:hypothetical protein